MGKNHVREFNMSIYIIVVVINSPTEKLCGCMEHKDLDPNYMASTDWT